MVLYEFERRSTKQKAKQKIIWYSSECKMRIFTIVVFNFFISHSEGPGVRRADEEAFISYYIATNHAIAWNWEPKSYCKSQTPGPQSPLRFRRAYLTREYIMLEQARCTKIQMGTLHCEYSGADTGDVRLRNSYVNGLIGEVYRVAQPITSLCDDPVTLIIHDEIFNGVRRRISPPRFTFYTDDRSSVLRTEKVLAHYHAVRGIKEWLWNPKMFCKIDIPPGFDFYEASFIVRNICLEWVNRIEIPMEVLRCEYRMEFSLGRSYESRWHAYTSGPTGELYGVAESDESGSWAIQYEIFGGVRAPYSKIGLQLSGIARVFQTFVAKEKEAELLRQRKWPQAPTEESIQ